MGIVSARQGRISPFTLSSAMTGSRSVLTQKKYIRSTEIRKFGSEFPIKLSSLTMLSSTPSFFTAVITASGSEIISETARLAALKISV